MVSIKIMADDTDAQSKILRIDSKVKTLNRDIEISKENIRHVARQASRFVGMILGQMERTAAVQAIQAAQTAVMAGISLRLTLQQASAAWAAGSYVQAGILTATAGLMAYSQADALRAESEAKRQEAYINSINKWRESYN